MSDYYTPNTEEIKLGYVNGMDESHSEYRDVFEGWFDRWLAATIRQAKAEAYDEAITGIDPNLFAYGEVEQDELRERNPHRIENGHG